MTVVVVLPLLTVTFLSTFSVPPLFTPTSCCQASLYVFPSFPRHPTCAQRRLHNRRTLSMFFVSIVPARPVFLCAA